MIRVCAPFGEMKSILMAFSSKSQCDYQMVHMHNYYVECLACNHNVFLWVMNLSIILNIVSFNSVLNSLHLFNIHKCIKYESDGFSKMTFLYCFPVFFYCLNGIILLSQQ